MRVVRDIESIKKQLAKLDHQLVDERTVESLVCTRVTAEEAKCFKSTIGTMMEILKIQGGVGIAAPQIGIPKNFFIIRTGSDFSVYFNATYKMKKKGSTWSKEGCLSYDCGQKFTDVKRFKYITVKYEEFIEDTLYTKIENLKDAKAIFFQHEADHCYGKTIFNSVPNRLMIR